MKKNENGKKKFEEAVLKKVFFISLLKFTCH